METEILKRKEYTAPEMKEVEFLQMGSLLFNGSGEEPDDFGGELG